MLKGRIQLFYVDMDQNGKRVDFAEVAAKYLNSDKLSGKVPANNPCVSVNAKSSNAIVRSKALYRKAGVTKFDGMKLLAELEPHNLGKKPK